MCCCSPLASRFIPRHAQPEPGVWAGGLLEFEAWHGWTGGPTGTFTDDTQLTVATAESLIAQVILTAVNAGYDADTVASMAGNLAGAWRGATELESDSRSWWADLEARDELIGHGDRLADLADKCAS